MTTQANGPQLPQVALATGADGDEGTSTRTTDDGVPVGAADAEADAVRSGAPRTDDTLAAAGKAALPDADADAHASDDGVPVGAADADADRRRTTDDE